jgi:ribosome biogenesis GTPase
MRRLTERQRRIVASRQAEARSSAARQGVIVAHSARRCLIEDAHGATHVCHTRANLGRLVCGDRVAWEEDAGGAGLITAVEPRRNLLAALGSQSQMRPLAANLDHVLVVMAVEPRFEAAQLDRYLAAVACQGLDAVVIVNKRDLLDASARADLEATLATYHAIGYAVLLTSTREAGGLDALRAQLAQGVNVLCGPSGVGKSSLVNALCGESARVGDLSQATGRGRQTTSSARSYRFGSGALVDVPGLSDLGLAHLTPLQLACGFVEFHTHAAHCRFNDCRHLGEPDCAVETAVRAGKISAARLERYRLLARDARP